MWYWVGKGKTAAILLTDIWVWVFFIVLREDVNLNCNIKRIYYVIVLFTLDVPLREKKTELYCSKGETLNIPVQKVYYVHIL